MPKLIWVVFVALNKSIGNQMWGAVLTQAVSPEAVAHLEFSQMKILFSPFHQLIESWLLILGR